MAKVTADVSGLRNVTANLNRAIRHVEGGTLKGLKLAALHIKEQAMPITPHSGTTGRRKKDGGRGVRGGGSNLRNSAFVSVERKTAKRIVARIGYTAKYASWVHEMPNDVNWTTPGTGNKFLEKAVRRNTREILAIIRANAKVK